jgi:hypothetical protein
MSDVAYLTTYDALLCGGCALDTTDLVGDGRRWLRGLTAVPIPEVLATWAEARCEECERPFARSGRVERR